MLTFLAMPFVISAAVGIAALLWCRGFVPLVATALVCALVWLLVSWAPWSSQLSTRTGHVAWIERSAVTSP